jgi:hypothetical protein
MARDFLAIPAAGAGVERIFNISRDFVSYRRHNLKGPTVRLLMLIMAIDKFNLRESYKSIQMCEEWESPNPDEDDDQDELAGEANYISDDDEEEPQDTTNDGDGASMDEQAESVQESEEDSDNDYDRSTEEENSTDNDDDSDNDETTRPTKRMKSHHKIDRSQQSLRPFLISALEETNRSEHPVAAQADITARLDASPCSGSASQTPLNRQSVHESPKFGTSFLRPRGLARAIAETKAAAKQTEARMLRSSAGPSKVVQNPFQTPLKPVQSRPSSIASLEVVIPSPSPARSVVGSIKGKKRAV